MARAIRDFLYLDTERVRGLLAQLEGGVVDSVVERESDAAEAGGQALVFGLFNVRALLRRERGKEHAKSLQDAIFVVFEEAANELGLFREIEGVHDPRVWREGRIHDQLREAQLVRMTGPARIFDAKLYQQRAHRFADWSIVQERSTEEPEDEEGNPRERMTEDEKREETQFIRDLGDQFGLMLGGLISFRLFACGTQEPDFAFACTLSETLLQDEREVLAGRYGAAPSGWTLVAQVATLPPPLEQSEVTVPREEVVSRRTWLELQAALNVERMEREGFFEGPTYPSVSVTPLAVYREVPA